MDRQEIRAAVAERPGPLGDVLSVRSVQAPHPLGEGEVAVRMIASTVNPSDAVTVSGAYGSRTTFPFVPGFEGVGVIEEVGPGVPRQEVGRRVLPIGSAGAWQQIKRAEHSWCVPVPEDLTDERACFAYINPLTALLMVERFCASQVRQVAITAATSTIAGHLAELLSQRGITPLGLSRGTPGRRVADRSRWRTVIPTSAPDWPERLRSAAGSGVDLVLDCVGGPQGLELARQLSPGGTLVHYGLLSGQQLPPECFDGGRGTQVEMFRLRDVVHAHPRHQLATLFQPVFDQLRAGNLRTAVTDRIGLTSLPRALRSPGSEPSGKIEILVQR